MPGCIVGCVGKQRSGKTLIAYLIAKGLYNALKKRGYNLRVYANLYCPEDEGFIYISSISQVPLDLEPKIVLIDEIYNGCDAQDYKKLKEISIFLNTIGKQNCLFIYTTIEAGMVYNRFRNQTDCFILVRKNRDMAYYRFFFPESNKIRDFKLRLDAQLFKDVLYDTNFIPVVFDWSMKSWQEKLHAFYARYYPDIELPDA